MSGEHFTIDERVNYYTAGLSRQWVINFDQLTGKCFYKNDEQDLIYTAPLENQHGTIYIGQNYTAKMFEELALDKFNGRIIDGEKDLPSIDIIKAINNYNINAYINPCIDLLNTDIYFKDKFILHRIGDVYFNTDVPIITKTRPAKSIHELNNVIINLDSNRHWYEPIKQVTENDINFNEKNNKIIWRGAPNGLMVQHILKRPVRCVLCDKFQNEPGSMIDIGFQYDWKTPVDLKDFLKDYQIKGRGTLSIADQLKSKFIISLFFVSPTMMLLYQISALLGQYGITSDTF